MKMATEKRKMESESEEGSRSHGEGRGRRRTKLSGRDCDFSVAAPPPRPPVDILNQLPNDILHSILSRLTLRDGFRLTVLSSRWKDLWVSYMLQSQHRLSMDWGNLFDDYDRCISSSEAEEECPCTRRDGWKLVRAVDQFLDFFSRCIEERRGGGGGGAQVRLFEVKLCFRSGYAPEIHRWIDFVVRDLKVEELRLCFLCRHYNSDSRNLYDDDWRLSCTNTKFEFRSFSWHRVTSLLNYGLKSLYLSSCFLGPDCFSTKHRFGCHRIRTLCLTHVPLRNYDIASMLSCLVNVENLSFFHCSLPDKLSLNSMHALKSLEISFCPCIQELHLFDNINLTTFVCRNTSMIWDFVGAPELHEWIANIDAGGASSFFTNAWRNLPSLGVVSFASKADLFQCLPDHLPTFNSVTEMSLQFEGSVRFDVSRMVSLLKAYPNLTRLSLWVDHSEDIDQKRVQSGDHVIKHLKEVELLNFRATSSVVEFTVYLLRHTISLKRLTFRTCSSPYDLQLCDNEDLLKILALQELAKGVDLIVI